MAVALIVILYIINIISWCFLFRHFKKMFSADGVIENVKLKLNSLLIQIDTATDRNIKLINERIKDLKLISAEADNKIQVLQDKINIVKKNELLKNEADQVEMSRSFEEKVYADLKPSFSRAYSPVHAYQKEQMSYSGSPMSVSEEISAGSDINQKSSTVEHKNELKEVPFVSIADELVKPKKDFKTIVHELKNLGYTVEEIAAETGKSTQEVKIILEFS